MSEDLLNEWSSLKDLDAQKKFVKAHNLPIKFVDEHVLTDEERVAKLNSKKEEKKDDNSTVTKQD